MFLRRQNINWACDARNTPTVTVTAEFVVRLLTVCPKVL